MATGDEDLESALPLTPAVFHILLALWDGERHGYAIMQEVAQRSDNAVRMGPGTLYGSIKRMLAAGMIEEGDERSEGTASERRRYYRITEFGRRVAAAEAGRLAELVAVARSKRVLPEGT